MYTYRFPVVRGLQANKEYYIAMVPIGMLERLFPSDDEIVSPEYRAQRRLNIARIPTIRDYVLENRNNYVFSALSASIDGKYSFIPSPENDAVGTLEVSLDAVFLINDGQHRKAALLEAIKEDRSLRDETISVVFFEDQGLARSQQMFTDLNKHAVKTSNSISELYDLRDPLAVRTKSILAKVLFFEKYVDKEKDNLGKFASKLFTLNAFYSANRRALKGFSVNDQNEQFLVDYWSTVVRNITEWQLLEKHEIPKKDLRENYIITQSVVLQAFGRLGNYYLKSGDDLSGLDGLRNINWQRDNPLWVLRAIAKNGRIVMNESSVILTCNIIKKQLGIKLDEKELLAERQLEAGVTQNE